MRALSFCTHPCPRAPFFWRRPATCWELLLSAVSVPSVSFPSAPFRLVFCGSSPRFGPVAGVSWLCFPLWACLFSFVMSVVAPGVGASSADSVLFGMQGEGLRTVGTPPLCCPHAVSPHASLRFVFKCPVIF